MVNTGQVGLSTAMTEQKNPSMSDRIHQFRIFVQVAETSSFVGAARALNLPPATVSYAIRMLEKELGVRLLHRTTRQVSLTQEGQKALPMARKLAADLEDLYSQLKSDQQVISGKLKVDVPSRIASQMIAPALPSLMAKYPALELHVSSNDRRIDLVKESIDCAIRIGHPHNESLVCKPLGKLELVNCASPGYLAEHGTPQHPDALIAHWAIGYAPQVDTQPAGWNYVDPSGAARTVSMRYRVVVNSVESYLACCKSGMGLIQIPRFDAQHLLESGELVEVMTDWPAEPLPIAALYLHRSQRSPRMAAFIDWFEDLLKRSATL